MKYTPTVNEHLYLYTPCNNYWVNMVRNPYTVESVKGNVCTIRAALPIFNGPQYYDSLPDEIRDNPDGERITLRWSDKRQRWQESPAGSYPQVAVFGEWDYQPYLN